MNKKRITSIDVARCAGVSASAVSRTYSAPGKVSQATRSRVLAAADQLGYRPNALARALVNSGRHGSGIVAVVMGEFDNPFQPWLFSLLTQALQQHGLCRCWSASPNSATSAPACSRRSRGRWKRRSSPRAACRGRPPAAVWSCRCRWC
nr:LacI family DNA-binding transcriptional regulator [Dickeya dadantii]